MEVEVEGDNTKVPREEEPEGKGREGKGTCRALAIGQFSGREPRPGRPSKKRNMMEVLNLLRDKQCMFRY